LPIFLYYRFKSSVWHSYIYTHGDTGVRFDRVSIKDDVFFNMPLSFPILQEQYKISHLLQIIDQRIVTQNKIIEDLKKLKSAIYQNVFGTIKTSIVTLDNICNIVKGQQINGEFLSDKGKYYVMNGGTAPSGYYSYYNNESNTISISEGGNSCGYIQYNREPFWSGGHCYTLQDIASDVSSIYLYHYLKYREGTIMKLRIGSGLPNIQKKDLSKFKVRIPTKERQNQLKNIFSSIYTKCNIEEALLNEYANQKRYLLQQMFI
jgi:type I restriction enzyme S subunit